MKTICIIIVFVLSTFITSSRAITANPPPIFGPEYIDHKNTNNYIDTSKIRQNYLTILKNNKTHLGIYGIGEYKEDINNQEESYRYGLEWRLFNGGYQQAQREKYKKILQAQIEFLKMRKKEIHTKYQLLLQHIQLIRNHIELYKIKEKIKIIDKIIKQKQQKMEAGFATFEEFEEWKNTYKELVDKLKVLKKIPQEFLTSKEFELLNNIESIQLKSNNELLKLAINTSPDIQLQAIIADKTDFIPSWKDDLDLKIFALNQKEFYRTNRTVIGLKVAIPLYIDKQRDKLINTTKTLYNLQKEQIKQKIKQEIIFWTGKYQLAILQLQQAIMHYSKMQEKIQRAKIKAKLFIHTSDEVESLMLKMIDIKYDVLYQRVAVYETIISLADVIGVEDPTTLLQSLHSQAH